MGEKSHEGVQVAQGAGWEAELGGGRGPDALHEGVAAGQGREVDCVHHHLAHICYLVQCYGVLSQPPIISICWSGFLDVASVADVHNKTIHSKTHSCQRTVECVLHKSLDIHGKAME